MIELLKDTQIVLGVLLGLSSLLAGTVVWVNKRMRAAATDVTSEFRTRSTEIGVRVEHVEKDVIAIKDDVNAIRDDLHRVTGRVGSVEHSIEALARREDVAMVRGDLRELTGKLVMQAEMVDTLYKAALRASLANKKQD